MKEKYNVGIIGIGSRMSELLKHLPGLGNCIDIAAVHDISQQSIGEFQQNYRHLDPIVCDTYRELVEIPEIDWVFVGSWNSHHKEHVCAALHAGKHVFCEKPMAVSVNDCDEIMEAYQNSACKFIIGFTLRYSPHYRKIKTLIESNSIGKIISIEFNETLPFFHGGHIHSGWRRKRANSGGHMLEKCCHDLDIANWLVNSRPELVASFGDKNFFIPENIRHQKRIGRYPDGKEAYNLWWGKHDDRVCPFSGQSDIVDNQLAIIQYENQVRAMFHTNCNSGIPERRIYICGEEGAIRADALSGKIELGIIRHDSVIIDESTGVSGGHGGGDKVLGQELADSILGNTDHPNSLEDGLNSTLTALAIDKAMIEKRVIRIADLGD